MYLDNVILQNTDERKYIAHIHTTISNRGMQMDIHFRCECIDYHVQHHICMAWAGCPVYTLAFYITHIASGRELHDA
jgi:hypothetical protein